MQYRLHISLYDSAGVLSLSALLANDHYGTPIAYADREVAQANADVHEYRLRALLGRRVVVRVVSAS